MNDRVCGVNANDWANEDESDDDNEEDKEKALLFWDEDNGFNYNEEEVDNEDEECGYGWRVNRNGLESV